MFLEQQWQDLCFDAAEDLRFGFAAQVRRTKRSIRLRQLQPPRLFAEN